MYIASLITITNGFFIDFDIDFDSRVMELFSALPAYTPEPDRLPHPIHHISIQIYHPQFHDIILRFFNLSSSFMQAVTERSCFSGIASAA